MIDALRILLRLILVLGWTLPCMLIQACMLGLPGHGAERFARLYWCGVRRIVGMRITLIGTVSRERPVLFVVNHSSWLDIIALGSVLPGCFVAKGEIAAWPLFSLIARLGRTIYVSRDKSSVQRERADMLQRLAAGDNLILFPEGTTSDGCRVLKFQSAFLAVAEGVSAPHVQPVTLVYDRISGLPIHRQDRPVLSWYGAMDMVSHVPGVFRLRSFHATMVLDAAIAPATYPNRKILSVVLEDRLAANSAALRQGRFVTPLAALATGTSLSRV